MDIALKVIAAFCLMAGTAFSVIGVIGNIRMPDVYTRLHALGKVSTFGVVLLLLGAAAVLPGIAVKAFVMILMLLVVGPVVSHALAAAAVRAGVPMTQHQKTAKTTACE